jgi:hypothetical protein
MRLIPFGDAMNGLFRIAFRTLCWGLIVAVSITTVVMAKGIHPDVMVTFQRKADPQPEMIEGTNPKIGDEDPQPPEFYARAETPSRLDVSGESGFAASQRGKDASDQRKPGRLRQSKKSLSVAPSPETDTRFDPEPPNSPNRESNNDRLPPPASELDTPEEIATVAPDQEEASTDLFVPPSRAKEFEEPAETQLPAVTDRSLASNEFSTTETASIEQEASPNQGAPQDPAVPIHPSPATQATDRRFDQNAGADSAPTATTTELPEATTAPRRQSFQSAIKKTVEPQETPQRDGAMLPTKPMPESQPSFSVPGNTLESGAEPSRTSKSEAAPMDSAVVDRLAQMQRQLDQITLKQQQDRDSAQSLFETSQLYQQRRLEQKLQGVEKGLRELRTERSLPAATLPAPGPASPPTVASRRTKPAGVAHPVDHDKAQVTSEPDTPAHPLVKVEKPGPDGEKRYSVNSQHGDLRELLDALAQKADLKLVLAINVPGNVELNLRSVTADQALEAIKNSTGYTVEKSGRKVYVSQPINSSNQRPVFLPPIIRPAKDRAS